MKIAVTDYTFGELDIETGILKAIGAEVVGRRTHDEAELVELVRDADCVITQFAPINARVIEAMQRARAIVRYGIGVDNVDLAAAASKGIPVCNVPDYCIDEVADHTLALLLALTRRIVVSNNYIRDGKWGTPAPLTSLHSLKQLRVGIVGFGRIGREVARRLLAFKSPVQVFDPQVSASEIKQAGCEPVDLERLCETSDVVSLHCPSTAATRGMINAERLKRFKPGSLLINVGAWRSGRYGGAGRGLAERQTEWRRARCFQSRADSCRSSAPQSGQRRVYVSHCFGQRAGRVTVAQFGGPDGRIGRAGSAAAKHC